MPVALKEYILTVWREDRFHLRRVRRLVLAQRKFALDGAQQNQDIRRRLAPARLSDSAPERVRHRVGGGVVR